MKEEQFCLSLSISHPNKGGKTCRVQDAVHAQEEAKKTLVS